MKSNEDGEIEHVIEIKEYKVFHRIYLSLQEDEVVELANPFLESCLMTD
jgi:DNA primase